MHKTYRLTQNEDFRRVYRQGQSYANRQLVLYVMKQPKNERFRVGISASGKIGNAVVRNRLRRMIKEIVRHHEALIPDHLDIVIIVRQAAVGLDYSTLERSVLHLLRKAELLKKRN